MVARRSYIRSDGTVTKVIEVVRSSVPDERVDEMLARRPAAMARFQEEFPGLLSATLGRLEDGSWIDVIVWRSREEAEEASRRYAEIPELASFMALVGEVHSFDLGTVEHALA